MAWTGAADAAPENPAQTVVYHINGEDPNKQKTALRNIQNHITAVGGDRLELQVVVHGNGVSLLLLPEALAQVKGFQNANADPRMQAAIDRLKNQGVRFKVCANTLKARQVRADEHLYRVDAADMVPSGVAELARLQARGFTYIKP